MSVPRPWPRRRPIWQLMIGGIALAVGVISLIDVATDASPGVLRWITAGVWFLIGAGWILQWRRVVKQYDAASHGNHSSDRSATDPDDC